MLCCTPPITFFILILLADWARPEHPVVSAARAGHIGILEGLLEKFGQDQIDARGIRGNSALHEAADRGDQFVVQWLLEHGADPEVASSNRYTSGDTALVFATKAGHPGVLELLLEAGSDVEASSPSIYGPGRFSPLHWAVLRGRLDLVQILAEHGARLDETVLMDDSQSMSPQELALERGFTEIAEFIRSRQAEAQVK